MRYDEFERIFQERPFEPVRIYITRGKPLDITHPEQIIVRRSMFIFAVGPKSRLVERTGWHSLIHVVKVVPLKDLRRQKSRKQRTA